MRISMPRLKQITQNKNKFFKVIAEIIEIIIAIKQAYFSLTGRGKGYYYH